MNRILNLSLGFVLIASSTAFAQNSFDTASEAAPARAIQRPPIQIAPSGSTAFSRMSFGTGISPLGVGIQVSTNLNAHMNLRGTGNLFKYDTSFTTSGIPANAKLNLASGGALVDYYPFHLGFRLSAGMLFVNDNQMSANASITPGNSITLNGQDYYSASPNQATGATPLTGTGALYLNGTKPGAVVTTGWGNHVKRSGHWSFPIEIGAAFVGTPKVNVNITGWACADPAQTQCTNIADPNSPIAQKFQSDLQAQVQKWNNNISALETYPVLSFGVAYSFQIRSGAY